MLAHLTYLHVLLACLKCLEQVFSRGPAFLAAAHDQANNGVSCKRQRAASHGKVATTGQRSCSMGSGQDSQSCCGVLHLMLWCLGKKKHWRRTTFGRRAFALCGSVQLSPIGCSAALACHHGMSRLRSCSNVPVGLAQIATCSASTACRRPKRP